MAEKFKYTREWTDAEAFPLLGFTKSWENPEDYPTIELDETQVRKDMQSLHDEVKNYINDKLIPAVLAEDATENARVAAEAERERAETERVRAEEARQSNEAARVAAENAREAAEQARADENTGIVAQATEQANLASNAAASAWNSAAAAANSKSAAASSASSAAESAAAASTSEANAMASETAAKASETAAKASETAAKTSETSAKSEADRAKSEADRAAKIVGGDFATRSEAKGYANTAERNAKSYADQQIAAITVPKAEIFSVSLPASGWSNNAQIVRHAMLKAAGYGYIYNPDEASYVAYVSALVRCGDVVTDGRVTFYCDETPTDDITVDFMRSEANENV